MIDKYISWNIDGIQANTVLEGAEVNIPIDKKNLSKIIIDEALMGNIKCFNTCIENLFKSKNVELSKDIINEFKLSYMVNSFNKEYYIGFDFNTIFNNILRRLKMEKRIKIRSNVIDYSNKTDLIEEIQREINFQCKIKKYDNVGLWKKEEMKIIFDLYVNINSIIDVMISLENLINERIGIQIDIERQYRNNKKALSTINKEDKSISWKDLMFYTSIMALDVFEKTNDIKYYNYAKNYYLNVSRDNKTEYPCSMKINGNFYDYQFLAFNRKFMNNTRKLYSSLDMQLGLDTIDVVYCSLKDGEENTTKGVSKKSNKKQKITEAELSKRSRRKITYYKGLVSSGKIKCAIKEPIKDDLNYRGFVFENNYVVFDKFYEVSKSNKIVPAYGSAVYVTSLDIAVQCDFDRAKIREYISKNHDYKAFRFFHNDTDSYQDKINEVQEYEDISFIKFKELKLLNENKQNS